MSYLHDAAGTSGRCFTESINFQTIANRHGYSLDDFEVVYGDDPKFCKAEPEYDQHVFLLFQRQWVIDFTGRQYWSDCTVPIIERIDVYASRFSRVYGDDGFNNGPQIDLVQRFHERVENLV